MIDETGVTYLTIDNVWMLLSSSHFRGKGAPLGLVRLKRPIGSIPSYAHFVLTRPQDHKSWGSTQPRYPIYLGGSER